MDCFHETPAILKVLEMLAPSDLLRLNLLNKRFYDKLVPLTLKTVRLNLRWALTHMLETLPFNVTDGIWSSWAKFGPLTLHTVTQFCQEYKVPLTDFDWGSTSFFGEFDSPDFEVKPSLVGYGQYSAANDSFKGVHRWLTNKEDKCIRVTEVFNNCDGSPSLRRVFFEDGSLLVMIE